MIQETFQRTRGNEPPFSAIICEKTVDKALTTLLLYEIGYGGIIVTLESTKVTVVTGVMECIDTTTFTGDVEEMALLTEAAAFSIIMNPMQKHARKEYTDSVVNTVMEVTKGNPLLIKMSSGIVIGNSTLKNTLMAMCQNEEAIIELKKLNTKDLMAIVIMVRLEGVSLKEAMELAV